MAHQLVSICFVSIAYSMSIVSINALTGDLTHFL
jgi:hypothetical protein